MARDPLILLARHGQTAANAEGRLLGRGDPPLTDLGRRQAVALGRAIAASTAQPVGLVVTSPLARARETAAVLGLGCPVEVDDRWIEIDYGEYEGKPLGEVPGEMWRRWRADAGYRPPGGESLTDVGCRVRDACSSLERRARDRDGGGDVVVVSHVSPIKAAVAWALAVGESTAWRMHLSVASVTRVAMGESGPVLQAYNDTAHLLGLS